MRHAVSISIVSSLSLDNDWLPQSWSQWEAHVRTRHWPTSERRADDPFSCGGTPHQCGKECALHLKEGCLKKCCKVSLNSIFLKEFLTHCQDIDHDDDEHTCAARTHTCGAPCSLQVDGNPLCTRKCVADWQVVLEISFEMVDLSERFSHEEHERHCCSLALSCPVKCQLCNSFCSAGDHFHALGADAIHLCG